MRRSARKWKTEVWRGCRPPLLPLPPPTGPRGGRGGHRCGDGVVNSLQLRVPILVWCEGWVHLGALDEQLEEGKES
jgi:hypothetical protein